jgi:hypothetical protein
MGEGNERGGVGEEGEGEINRVKRKREKARERGGRG